MDPKLAARLAARLSTLTEAGRVLSAPNESALRSAIAALQTVLAKIAKGETPTDKATEAAISEARRLLESDLSFNDRERAIRSALKARFGEAWCWPRETYDDRVIFEVEDRITGVSRLYQADYTVDANGAATIADPVEVRAETRYVPMTTPAAESAVDLTGDLVPLVEKALRKDGTTTVKIIQPGWGSSGYYSAEMLERDGPQVFKKGLHMYVDHPTAEEESQRPERSVRDIAAVLETDATYQANGAAGAGLYADVKVLPSFAQHLEALAPHIGASIRASGKAAVGEAEGKRGQIVESLVAAQSVDFVTRPGAGGQVLQLFEAARGRTSPPPVGGSPVNEQEAQALRESNTTLTTQLTEQRTQLARMQEALVLRDARDVATETLRAIEMPDMTRARLLEAVVRNPPVKDGALDQETFIAAVKEAATAELAYIAGLSGAGAIRGMGSAGATAGDSAQREAAQTSLAAGLARLGLSESAAKTAAAGRS